MASPSRSKSPLKDVTKHPPLATGNTDEIDVEIPTLTDADIVIIQDQISTKPVSLGSVSTSSIKDTSVSEIGIEDVKVDEPLEIQDVKVDEPPLNQPSDGDVTEIDAIQKHVEESLLFLDHEKEANNISETIESISDPINKIDSKTAEPMESEHETTSETLDPPVISSTHENYDQALITTEQAPNATAISVKMEENIKLPIAPIEPIIIETQKPVENLTATNQEIDKDANDNVNLEPVQVSLTQDSILPMEEARHVKLVSDIVIENVDKNEHLELSSKSNTEQEEVSPANNNDASPLLKEQDMNLNKIETPIQEIANAGLTSCEQSQTIELSEKSDENIENIQFQPKNTSQDMAGESSALVNTQKENNKKPTDEDQSSTVHESFQKSKSIEEIPISKNMSKDKLENSPIISPNKEIVVDDNMGEDAGKSANESSMKDIDKDATNSENIADTEPSHTLKQVCISEYSVIPDSTQKEKELEVKEEITIKQKTVAANPEVMEMPETENENINDSESCKPIETVIKQEKDEDTKNSKGTDCNVIDPSQTTTKQNVLESAITEQKAQKTNVESIENNTHLVSVVPIQDTAQVETPQQTQNTPEIATENVTYNANCVDSASLKVVPIRNDVTDYPPAKRPRVETKWFTLHENIDTKAEAKQSNAAEQSYIETYVPAIHTWALKKNSFDDMEVQSPAHFESSETFDETAFKSQSPYSTIPEEMEDSDGDEYQSNSAPGTISEAEFASFIAWCKKHDISGELSSLKKKLFIGRKLNKDALKITQLPGSYGRSDILNFIKKYTSDIDKNILNHVSNVYINKSSSPVYNTAHIKWKTLDKDIGIKVYLILCKLKPCINGTPIMFYYDNRMHIDWNANDKPIIRPIRPKMLPGGTMRSQTPIEPFANGQMDESDNELFGLSKEFLKDLNITPPLTCEIVVKNLDRMIDECTIWRTFRRAGNIRSLAMQPMEHKCNTRDFLAKKCVHIYIEYEHPLEAVQAISLYHCQVVYDRVIVVSMVKPHNKKIKLLPSEGFRKIGPGLASGGRIMTNVHTVIETGQIKKMYQIELQRIKAAVKDTFTKVSEVLARQEQLAIQMNAKKNHIQNPTELQPKPQESSSEQNTENAFAALTSVLTNSIQTNILGMLGVQPNLVQGLMPQNQTPNWSQQNQPFPQPGLANMQPTPYMQYVPNLQPTPGTITDPNQPDYRNIMLQGFTPTLEQPIPVQYIHGTKTQGGFSNVQAVQPVLPPLPSVPPPLPSVPPPLPSVPAVSNRKPVSRFDIPPVVAKPQNRTETVPNTAQTTDNAMEIPLPVTKPQNRKLIPSNLKTGKIAKPKPMGIKFNIPSLQVPIKAASPSDVDVDQIPSPVAKEQKKGTEASTSKALKAATHTQQLKAKSPDQNMPWINKQIKAMRRNSKSPEGSRTHSPRYDQQKDVRRSRERDHSRERDRSIERDGSRETNRSRERDYSNARERELERDYNRPFTVIFKYLPRSVNSEDLREKMREIGKLVSAQVNGKGHAVVSFRLRRDAETCIEMYNRAKVDGETIEVKWAK